MTHYYSIFKTDNISGKTILICGGSHDTIEECNIHWISYLYGFMDGAFELLGRNGFQMINGLGHYSVNYEELRPYFTEGGKVKNRRQERKRITQKNMNKASNHGGARPGAGRKKTENPRKNMTFSVSPATYKRAIVLRNQGVKVNNLVEEAIEQKFMDLTLPYSE